jgi:hypothetical protein
MIVDMALMANIHICTWKHYVYRYINTLVAYTGMSEIYTGMSESIRSLFLKGTINSMIIK